MAKGDTMVVNCPHCGRASSYTLTGDNVNQTNTCRHCSKLFMICITGGRVTDVRQ